MSIRHRPRSKAATPLESPDATAKDDVYLTIEEAAALIRSTPAAIYQMRRRGQGPPARRPGARLLFRRSELLAWLDAQPDGRSARSTRRAA
jgi:excisionase family DNA binding protein